uniref:FAD-binding oxidoreductase n=1 Tax=Sphingomonas sp. TaxID=28214 RepID=UPI00181D2089
ALDLLRKMQGQSDIVEGFEIIPASSLGLVLEHIPGTRSPLQGSHPWHVLVEATSADSSDPPGAELERMLGQALLQGRIADAAMASSEAQADAFWRIRDSISEAERASGGSIAHDISVPVADMPRFMTSTAAELERAFPGVEPSAFGHLGDGNVHFHVRAGSRASPDWLTSEGPAITRMVHDLVTAAGGSISAEHGIGQMKLNEFERLAPPGRIAALKAIKLALDPLGIMNPGKLVR